MSEHLLQTSTMISGRKNRSGANTERDTTKLRARPN